jgi:hypothetical protein
MSELGMPPGVHFVLMKHDAGCPAKETQSMFDCVCEPELEITTQAGWVAAVNQTRAERRRAEREAAKALRTARGRD